MLGVVAGLLLGRSWGANEVQTLTAIGLLGHCALAAAGLGQLSADHTQRITLSLEVLTQLSHRHGVRLGGLVGGLSGRLHGRSLGRGGGVPREARGDETKP